MPILIAKGRHFCSVRYGEVRKVRPLASAASFFFYGTALLAERFRLRSTRVPLEAQYQGSFCFFV